MITVVNVRMCKEPSVYIGRRMPNRSGSPLANPFRLTPYLRRFGKEARDYCLAAYLGWLTEQMTIDDSPAKREIERLADIAETQDLLLGCWCKPDDCHGDIVKSFIEQEIYWRHAFTAPPTPPTRPTD